MTEQEKQDNQHNDTIVVIGCMATAAVWVAFNMMGWL